MKVGYLGVGYLRDILPYFTPHQRTTIPPELILELVTHSILYLSASDVDRYPIRCNFIDYHSDQGYDLDLETTLRISDTCAKMMLSGLTIYPKTRILAAVKGDAILISGAQYEYDLYLEDFEHYIRSLETEGEHIPNDLYKMIERFKNQGESYVQSEITRSTPTSHSHVDQ